MNLILQAIKAMFRKMENKIPKKLSDLTNDLKFPPPDWNQNDPNGEGYIKNRPFFKTVIDRTLFNGTITENEAYTAYPRLGLQYNTEYIVILDGTQYRATSYYNDSDSAYALWIELSDGVFLEIYDVGYINLTNNSTGKTHNLTVIQPAVTTVKHIPDEFLPESVVRTDINQQFSIAEQKQARENIGAIELADLPANSVWIAESAEFKLNTSSCTIKVILEKPGFVLRNGVIVIVPKMPYVDTYGPKEIYLSIGNRSSPIYSMADSIIEHTSDLAWPQYATAMFIRISDKWYAYPLVAANTNRFGFVKLSNDTTLESPYYAASAYAVKKTYDKILNVESRAILSGAKELLLTSSTENSEKKFRITVDDSGTITLKDIETGEVVGGGNSVNDEYINALIDAKLGVIENGTY